MKKLFVFLFIAIHSGIVAQDVVVEWGRATQLPKRSYLQVLLGEHNESYYAVRFQASGFLSPYIPFLENYSKGELRLLSSKPLILPRMKGQDAEYEKVFLFQEEVHFFTSFYDKTSHINSAYLQTLKPDGRLTHPRKVDEMPAQSPKRKGIFDIALSEDSSKLLIYHNEPFEKDNKERFNCKVLDENLNELWTKFFELPYTDRQVTIYDYMLDHQGNMHLLASVNEDVRWSPGDPSYKYIIVSYFREDNEIKEFEIKLDDRSISDVVLHTDNGGHLLAAGFHSNQGRSSEEIAGVFFLKINLENKEVITTRVNDFSDSFLEKFLSERQIEKERELESFDIDYLEPTPDGNFFLVAEQYWYQQTCISDPRTGTLECTDNYHYNDIMLIKLDSMGRLVWAKRIPKRQYSTNDGGPYASYLFGTSNNKAFMIFNDNLKNLAAKENSAVRYMNNPSRSVIMQVEADAAGNLNKTILFTAKDNQIILRPKRHLKLSDNKLLLYGSARRTGKIGTLSLPVRQAGFR